VTEIQNATELQQWLDAAGSPRGVRIQGVDLTAYAPALLERTDLRGLAVFGGVLPNSLAAGLSARGALVFPSDPRAPVDTYRGSLYQPEELYAGLENGYAGTPDARAYGWSRDGRIAHDALVTAVRALHDDAMSDALGDALRDRPAVGVMGGHALRRDTEGFADAARLGRLIADHGWVVVTGGGPGAMEAANLGAYCDSDEQVDASLQLLASSPGHDDIDAWASTAFRAKEALRPARPDDVHSIGIPTWFYGHEPPNVFCDGIAKYFSNALREDWLLGWSTAGLVVLPGAAGTVQEIFQAATPYFYSDGERPLAPFVLIGVQHWTEQVPVWPALRALAAGRPMASALHLVETVQEAASLVAPPV
jgi:predicted Rossmann-fold nucleotide-binding protein